MDCGNETENGKTEEVTEAGSSTCSTSNISHKRKKLSTFPAFVLNESLRNVGQNVEMVDSWRNASTFTDDENLVTISGSPFIHAEIRGFVANEEVLDKFVQKAFSKDVKLQEKVSDLFQFKQSYDLQTVDFDGLPELRNFFETEVLDFLRRLTQFPLNGRVDMFLSDYRQTDHLLCHDDELESRRIAFILYLSKDWNTKFGGTLDLFNSTDDIQPSTIAKSITPEYNKFVFFDVTCKSFHQVSEVIEPDKRRLALSGWFVGEPLPRLKLNFNMCIPSVLLSEYICESDHYDLDKYCNPTYVEKLNYPAINAQLEEDSEVMLVDFFNEEVFSNISKELDSLEWKISGPANMCTYYISSQKFWPYANQANTTNVERMIEFFHSVEFLQLLEALTEFPFTDKQQTTMVSSHLGKYKQKCYKLLKSTASDDEIVESDSEDDEEEEKAQYVDVLYFGGAFNWEESFGGEVVYNDIDGEQLISVSPVSNSLAVIVRTKSVNSYINYVNCLAKESRYYLYSMTFYFSTCE